MLVKEFINKLQEKELKIAVVGDVMIDEYYQVSVNRISPEFPIPVEHCDNPHPKSYPGGAANVAYQFQNLNTKVHLYGIQNKNSLNQFQKDGLLSAINALHDEAIVPIKQRFYDGINAVSRRDIEQVNYGLDANSLAEIQKKLHNLYQKQKYDITIFSDYNKGMFIGKDVKSQWIKSCKGISVVDPKVGDVQEWQGCTVFKPNVQEAINLTGHTDWMQQAKYLANILNCKGVVITQGGEGTAGIDLTQTWVSNPFFKVKPKKLSNNLVKSYQGAGDCFVVFLSVAVGLGYNMYEASSIAYAAAAAYVHKEHNEPVTYYDLMKEVDPIEAKILPLHLIKNNLRDKVVFTNGCFDILHSGHIECLKFAKEQGDRLIVALNSDQSIRKLKGPSRPIVPLKERMKIIASLEFVDHVISFHDLHPYDIIEEIQPHCLVKGGEYKKEEVVGHNIVNEVFTFNMVEGKSTTNIISKIKSS